MHSSAHCTPGLLKVHLSAHDEGPSFRHSSFPAPFSSPANWERALSLCAPLSAVVPLLGSRVFGLLESTSSDTRLLKRWFYLRSFKFWSLQLDDTGRGMSGNIRHPEGCLWKNNNNKFWRTNYKKTLSMASIKSTLQMLNLHVGLASIKTLISNDPPTYLVSVQATNAWCLQLEPHLANYRGY